MTTLNRDIAGFSVSNMLSEESQQQAIETWTTAHSKEHEGFFSALNGLNTATGGIPYKINFKRLFFDTKSVISFNNFLILNNFQMNQFFAWSNLIGADLPNYGKPLMIIYPLLNPIRKTFSFGLNIANKFMYLEEQSHTILTSAINQLYEALGA
ncbi:MAG TPA: hypothetical protein ENI76_07885 [Ignavibacteria bacterium]|nr:hypothetical protein [Ignavibacteria bacterium]